MSTWNPYLDEARPLLSQWQGLEARRALVQKYAWAIPNEHALEVLAKHAPIVEIGAGNGYWARCLRERGVTVQAYDKKPYRNEYVCNRWTAVAPGRARKAKQFSDHTLFLCWPPYRESFAADCLRLYQGDTVIVVGESDGGCTANAEFFDMLDKGFRHTDTIDIPRWFGINDYLRVYERA